MEKQVLIIGGRGRIGSSVAADLLAYTSANLVVTGRHAQPSHMVEELPVSRVRYVAVDLTDYELLGRTIASSDVVVHCAGPFRQRDTWVLQSCIAQHVPYVDVSDDRTFTKDALSLHESAVNAGVTAVINSGVFPGISNSMVLQGVEQLDHPEKIHLSYVVGGSGGAGVTVMRTTFLNLQQPFEAWIDGQWKEISPYTEREMVKFQPPFGQTGVYWFDMPESYTLAKSFPVKTVITKFGSAPDFYNHLTWMAAHLFPSQVMQNPNAIEFLSHVSHKMTTVTDRFTSTGVAVRSEVTGEKGGQWVRYCSEFIHESAAIATGHGTGSIVQCILSGQLQKPGVWAVEQALTTQLFEEMMQSRKLVVHQGWQSENLDS
jgi:saccharopine dehydrogenase-like NADP-dependent oxidoreductase